MPGFVEVALSYAFGTALTGAALTVTAWAVTLTAGLAYSSYQRGKAVRKARDAWNASLEDRLVMLATVEGQRSRIYGRVRNVDGIMFKATHGINSEVYTLVVACAGHEIDAFEQIYLDDLPVTLDGSGYVLTAPYSKSSWESAARTDVVGAGPFTIVLPEATVQAVSAAYEYSNADANDRFVVPVMVSGSTVTGTVVAPPGVVLTGGALYIQYQWQKVQSKVRITKYLGAPGQNLYPALLERFPSGTFPGFLQTTDRFEKTAILLVDLTFDPDVFPTGVPTITAVMRGAKVYDPRNAVTAWSENPALIARDWALHPNGGGLSGAVIDDASVIAAANACDISTVYNLVGGVQMEGPRYTCGIVARTDQDPWQTFQEIVESMAGKAGWPGGRLRMRAGVYYAPVASINEDWLSGQEGVQIVPEPPADEAVNIYRPTISDSMPMDATGLINLATAYVAAPISEVRAAAYITLDGRELPVEITLGGVTHAWRAQHICGVLMREARSSLTLSLPCNFRAFALELFDVVYVSLERFGWLNKQFEVLGWQFMLSGGVLLTLKETAASIYQLDATFDLIDATPNTQLSNPFIVPIVTSLAAASGTNHLIAMSDGTIVTRVLVTWTPMTDPAVVNGGAVEVRYWSAFADESTATTVEVPGDTSQVYLVNLKDGELYLIKARAKNRLVRGVWAGHILHQVVGKTEPPVPVEAFGVIEQSGIKRLFAWTYDNPPVDLAGFRLRYGAYSAANDWSVYVPLGEASKLERSFETTQPPDGSYKFAIKAVDTSGNESTPVFMSWRFTQATLGQLIYENRAEFDGWPGVQDNCYVTLPGNYLVPIIRALEYLTYTGATLDFHEEIEAFVRVSQQGGGNYFGEYSISLDGSVYTNWAAVPATSVRFRYLRVRWTAGPSVPGSGFGYALMRASVSVYEAVST